MPKVPPSEIEEFVALAQERGYAYEFDSFKVGASLSAWVDIDDNADGISVQYQHEAGYTVTRTRDYKLLRDDKHRREFKTRGAAYQHVALLLFPRKSEKTR